MYGNGRKASWFPSYAATPDPFPRTLGWLAKLSNAQVDEILRGILHRYDWSRDAPPADLLALGKAGLDRLLDGGNSFFPDFMDYRDYGSMLSEAIAAHAKIDMPAVLAAMRKRKWKDDAIACSGVGLVRDVRVVPFLVRAAASKEPLVRKAAVEHLGAQEHPEATRVVVTALRDRSSDVRLAAIRALAQIADPDTREALEDAAERHESSLLMRDEIAKALAATQRRQ